MLDKGRIALTLAGSLLECEKCKNVNSLELPRFKYAAKVGVAS
jgi:hypothetical protein